MIAANVLSSTSQILGWLIYLPLLCWAIWRAPWVELCSDLRRQHLFQQLRHFHHHPHRHHPHLYWRLLLFLL